MVENGNDMVMPVAPMYGGNGGFGGFGNDLSWIVILFLFAMCGGGWGNGFGGFGGGGMFPWLMANGVNTNNDVQRGFDQAAVMSGINGVQGAVNSGFATAEVAACNRAMDAMQTSYSNQIASMNQSFAQSQALDNRLDTISMALQNCCCENRAAVADLKYTIATEACADRAAINDALRDVLEANTASTQRILDQMCQDKIADLRSQLSMAQFSASQNAQTAAIIANNESQTTALEQYLAPVPKPAYVVQNPNCCAANVGCGCGVA